MIQELSNHNSGLNSSSIGERSGPEWDESLMDKSESATKKEKISRRSDTEELFLGFPWQRWLLIFGDIFFIAFAHFIASWIRFGQLVDIISVYTRTFTITLIIYPIFLYIFDLYNINRLFRSWQTAYRSALAIIIGGTISIFIFYLVPYGPYGRGMMAIQMGITWILLNGLRLIYSVFYQFTITKIPALILGAGSTGRAVYELLKSPFSPYEIRGFVDDDLTKLGKSMSPAVLGSCDQIETISKQVNATAAIMAIPRNRQESLIRCILKARLQGISVKDSTDIFEQLTGRIPVKHIADQWLLFAEGFYLLDKEYVRKIKRLTDLIISAFVLVLTAPIIGLTALAIRFESPGPVLYTQKRIGKDQQTYTMYKFRSMSHNAETDGVRWASENDPRITRVGKLLRLTHIDELPQIWNIFRGDMSFVGPRPERPEFIELLEKEIPYYFVRHSIQPGLTGWAQINYKYGDSIEDAIRKLEYDLYYMKNMSILLDIKIILRTLGVVILRDGAR